MRTHVCARKHVLLQIHVLDGGKTVHIYSRNAEDMTPRYPDILARLPSWLAPGTDSIVIDGEAVAWDPEKAKILPFQVCTAHQRLVMHLLGLGFHIVIDGEAVAWDPGTVKDTANPVVYGA
jgi:ATP-dependent DNA ligase